jgi:hypothetical protein
MPKSTRELIDQCDQFRRAFLESRPADDAPASR